MERVCIRLQLLVIAFVAACSSDHTDEVQSRIAAVEKSLIAAVVNTGSEPAGMSLSDRMQHYRVPGVGIAVINNGQIEWAKGYGFTEAGGSRAVSPETLFQACSVSKPVSVAGIMLLAQSGAIDISRNVNDYLRSWHLEDNGYTTTEKATIRRLMSHTGGINVSGFNGYPTGSAIPTLLQVLNGSPPAESEAVRVVSVPGSEYSYSGGGMEVLQQMAEDVTGIPFQTYMKNNLFAGLGMNSSDSVQPLTRPLASNAARAHDIDGKVVPGGWNTYPELVAAGLWTTPTDLARLLIEVQKAATTNTGTLLTQHTAASILTRQPNSTTGLGFAIVNGRGGLLFNHSGSNVGYKSFFAAYRDRGQGVAIMTNGDNGMGLFMEIVRAVAKVYDWPDRFVEEATLVDVPLAVLQSYVGNYMATIQGQNVQIRIDLSGTMLMMKYAVAGTGQGSDMFPATTESFLVRDNALIPGRLTFLRNASGAVEGFTIALQSGGRIEATRK